MPGRWLATAALICVLAAITLPPGWEWWVQTRTWVPVEMPISLAAGHVKTPEFSINLASKYEVQILVDHRADPIKIDCFLGVGYRDCKDSPALDASWVLHQSGRTVAQGGANTARRVFWGGEGIGTFFGETGRHYSVDLEIRRDSSDLNIASPRLRIEEATDLGWRYQRAQEAIFAWAVVFFVLGVILLILALVSRRREIRERNKISLTALGPQAGSLYLGAVDSEESVYEHTCSPHFTWAQTFPLKPPVSGIPVFLFGVCTSIICILLMFVFMTLGPVPSKGLYVHLVKPGRPAPGSDRWTEPLVVRIKDGGIGQQPELYVNSVPVPWDKLEEALREELSRRSEWVVYVEGDESLETGYPMMVVDVAHGLRARVYLLTPNTVLRRP